MIDYRELLKKYIDHVGAHEGVDFIPKGGWGDYEFFTKEELDALWECSGWDEETKKYKGGN